jgi:hypothetical protein
MVARSAMANVRLRSGGGGITLTTGDTTVLLRSSDLAAPSGPQSFFAAHQTKIAVHVPGALFVDGALIRD